MASIEDESSGSLCGYDDHCRFPCSQQDRGGNRIFEVVSISAGEKSKPGSLEVVKDYEKTIQNAWALLLRVYIGKGHLSFGVIRNANTDRMLQKRRNQCIGQVLGNPLTLLRYDISSEDRVRDVAPISIVEVDYSDLHKALKVNTAIALFQPRCAKDPSICGDSSHVSNLDNVFSRNVSLYQDRNMAKRVSTDFDAQFDLVLGLNEENHEALLYHCSRRISRRYGTTIAHTFERILAAMASNSNPRVGQVNLVTDKDEKSICSWSGQRLFSRMTCLHYLFEASARVIPQSEAVCSWDGSVTYQELDATSSILSQRLIDAGVKRGSYVPFAFHKSLWVVVATLAILKAGGAFAPLDPTHPRSRTEDILRSTNAMVIVTSEDLVPLFQGLSTRLFVVSPRTTRIHREVSVGEIDSPDVEPQDPVFVLFTSGSTGNPKGMIHSHGSICTHALCHGEAMGYHGARVLQFAAYTFDVAIMDIFTTLLFGGCICIPSENDRKSDIVGTIKRMRVNHAILTPLFAGLIDPSEVPDLRILAIGGEPLRKDRLDKWARKVRLIQIYGPAEVGICLARDMDAKTAPENVGYPLRNSFCWLVSPEEPSQLVPAGAVGELVVAGPSLARGYLNDEEKTKVSFVNDLLCKSNGTSNGRRFFKTGDLLRYNTEDFDGSFDFVARKDSQIKLRGQRLEPIEVEHRLAEMEDVRVGVVARPTTGCFSGKLVAVVQTSDPSVGAMSDDELVLETSGKVLRKAAMDKYLSKHLPPFMIPSEYLTVKRMPLTSSLKLNRKVVIKWLEDMHSRPSELAESTQSDLGTVPLEEHEHFAIEVSMVVAETMAYEDGVKRKFLERHDFLLHQAGIDSLQLMSLSLRLREKFDFRVEPGVLWDSKISIRDLATMAEHPETSPKMRFTIEENERFIFHHAETICRSLINKVGSNIPSRSFHDKASIRNVFVTGATGTLGSAILQMILSKADMHAYALIRCPSESVGLERLIVIARKNGWWKEDLKPRLHVWPGDLTQPNFGLEADFFGFLKGDSNGNGIHAIVHSGARIHYAANISTLWPINVLPTVALLEIGALSVALSAFVFVSGGQRPKIGPDTTETMTGRMDQSSGYAQTKAISEKLVQICASTELFSTPMRIFNVKPGYIVGSLKAGLADDKDFIWRLVAGCVEIRAFNSDEASRWMFLADTERVADVVISPIFDEARMSDGLVENIEEGLYFSDFWKILKEDFGFALEPLRSAEWMTRLKAAILEKRERHALFPLLHVLEKDGYTLGSVQAPRSLRPDRIRRVHDAVRSNIRYLINKAFLPKPTSNMIERGEN